MTTGYFHYKKPVDLRKCAQILTVYYEITPSEGTLKYSCSLWKQGFFTKDVYKKDEEGNKIVTGTKQIKEAWVRKNENANAKANFDTECVVHKFQPFDQNNLKLDDIWLKRHVHKYICIHGRRKNEFLCNSIPSKGYKTVMQCYEARGHTIPSWLDPETGMPKLVQDTDDDMADEYLNSQYDQESSAPQEGQEEMGLLEMFVRMWYGVN